MKVLLTGSEGFIGSALRQALQERGWDVIGVDLKGNPEIKGDLWTKDCLQDILRATMGMKDLAAVFHLAWPMPFTTITPELASRALRGSAALAHYAARLPFIFASSCMVYGPPSASPIPESTWCYPQTLYASAKLQTELACLVACPDVRRARFTNIYGPGQQDAFVPNVLNALKSQRAHLSSRVRLEPGDPLATRDFLYIEDCVAALLQILAEASPADLEHPGVYNVGSGQATTLERMADIIIGNWDSYVVPEWPVNPERKVTERAPLAVDNEKLRRLQWAPTVDLPQGVKKTVEWFDGVS